MDQDQQRDAQRYRLLRDYLLLNGLLRHVKLSDSESEPFVVGTDFYGQTFGDAVDTLNVASFGKSSSRAQSGGPASSSHL